jgi:predicted nucleotidyltransferase
MFGLKEHHIEALNTCFAKYPQIEKVLIYGSRAIGTYKNGSDIDLTIIGEMNPNALTSILVEIDDLMLPYKIDLSIFTELHNTALIDHIERHGKVFYEKDEVLTFREPDDFDN